MTKETQFLRYKLSSLGSVFTLNSNYCINLEEFEKCLYNYRERFKPYNPRKKGYNRYGLSITSQDGGFSGVPELDSLYEYNQLHGTQLEESDFREWTPFFKNSEPLKEVMKPFHKYMGRSHVLQLNKAGFIPPHRDGSPTSFRLFISFCDNTEDYVFILNEKRVFFQPGRVYFINTLLSHSLFSFRDDCLFAVFNIDLCEEAVKAVLQNLSSW